MFTNKVPGLPVVMYNWAESHHRGRLSQMVLRDCEMSMVLVYLEVLLTARKI